MEYQENASAKEEHKCGQAPDDGCATGIKMHKGGKSPLDFCRPVEWNEAGTVGFADIEQICEETEEVSDRVAALAKTHLKPHFLYKHYSPSQKLLYVGITSDLNKRTRDHKRSSKWFNDDTLVRVVSEHPTFWIAEEYEMVSILTENPIHNKKRPWYQGGKMSEADAWNCMLWSARREATIEDMKRSFKAEGCQYTMALVRIHKSNKGRFESRVSHLMTDSFYLDV